jgi:hypothetical protein
MLANRVATNFIGTKKSLHAFGGVLIFALILFKFSNSYIRATKAFNFRFSEMGNHNSLFGTIIPPII